MIAGGAHQGRLDLIVAEDFSTQRPLSFQARQGAMIPKWLKTEDRVMAPIRSRIPLPPGAAGGVGAHPVAHAELEDPAEPAGGRHTDNQTLEDAELRIGLHRPNHM